MPIARLALALRDLELGDELEVLATDPAFLLDVQAWSQMTGHGCKELQHDAALTRVLVTKTQA